MRRSIVLIIGDRSGGYRAGALTLPLGCGARRAPALGQQLAHADRAGRSCRLGPPRFIDAAEVSTAIADIQTHGQRLMQRARYRSAPASFRWSARGTRGRAGRRRRHLNRRPRPPCHLELQLLDIFALLEAHVVGLDLGDHHAVQRLALTHRVGLPAIDLAQERGRDVADHRRAGQRRRPAFIADGPRGLAAGGAGRRVGLKRTRSTFLSRLDATGDLVLGQQRDGDRPPSTARLLRRHGMAPVGFVTQRGHDDRERDAPEQHRAQECRAIIHRRPLSPSLPSRPGRPSSLRDTPMHRRRAAR